MIKTRVTNRLIERIEKWSCPEPNTGCYLWFGARTNSGYGKISVQAGPTTDSRRGEKSRLVHRLSYELLVGPIPEGLTIDHLCRQKLCVNTDHMEPVTQAENTIRAVNVKYPGRNRPAQFSTKGRHTHCKNGHEFTDENTLWHTRPQRPPSGLERVCRICWVEKSRVHRARQAELGTRIGASS